jgi:two-component system, chemotaxis family, response regulator Rcp1
MTEKQDVRDAMTEQQLFMLVEDNPADVYLVRRALERADLKFEMRVFGDGEDALLYLKGIDDSSGKAPCPRLLLVDLNLPRFSGEEIMASFRRSPSCKEVPIVVLTSSDSPKDRQRAARLGVLDYFRKPSDYNDFMRLGDVIRKALDRAGVPAAGSGGSS